MHHFLHRSHAARIFHLLALISAVFLLIVAVGCGGNSSNSSSTSTTTPTPGSANTGGNSGSGSGGSSASLSAPKFVYALNSVAIVPAGVQAFRIDPSTGVLTATTGATIANTNSLTGLAATPATNFVFVADWIAKTITSFHADASSGALTKLATTAVPALQGTPELLVDQTGKFLFVSDSLANHVFAFSIGSDGSLTSVAGSPFSAPIATGRLSTDAAGHFLFGTANNQIVGFTIAANGALTPVPGTPLTVRAPFDNPDKGPVGIEAAIDPQARFLFVADSVNPVLHVYTIGASGALTEVSGSPFQIGAASQLPVVDPTGRFLFLGSYALAQVAAFSINQSTGAITAAPGSPYDNGPFRNGGAPVLDAKVDPSGKFLLLADSEETKITVFSIDQSTGALTNVPGSPFLTADKPLGGGTPSALAITH